MGIKISEEMIDEIAEAYTQNLCKTGAEASNYKILLMLPTTTNKIIDEIKLSKMTLYLRLNRLQHYNLISWQKRTTIVEKGELTDKFISAVNEARKYVTRKNIADYVRKRLLP